MRGALQLAEVLKDLETDVVAFYITLENFKKVHPNESTVFEMAFQHAKNSPRLSEAMNEKYDKALAQVQQTISDEQIQAKIEAWIQSWKRTDSTGLVN